MDPVARIRSFNRSVTQHSGALDIGFLGRGRPLGASRVLFEIGRRGIEIRRLRARLDLDAGYLSRLLRGLEGEGLVQTLRAEDDARVRFVRLSAKGRRELALLNHRSDEAAAALLQSLTPAQQLELTAAMAVVERLLLATALTLRLENPRSSMARFCLSRYFEELSDRFETGFDPARSIPAGAEALTPPRGLFVVASLHGEPVGCGGLKCLELRGEIKRMWVNPEARGLGIGRRILQHLEQLARERGIRVLRLETNRSLSEAQSLYRTSGYSEVAPFNDDSYAHHWFEKALTDG
jgi:DNA-binding MarR family transcriptional regulator/GNAT superfamily N-acetyltransferase